MKIWIAAAIFAVFAIAIGACSDNPPEMPNLIGMERGEIGEPLGEVGVEQWVERVEDTKGVVVYQDPLPGSEVTGATEVEVTIGSQ